MNTSPHLDIQAEKAAWLNKCHFGDVRDVLRRMAVDGVEVQTCVTSPPYFGLRSYLPDSHPQKDLEIGAEESPEQFIANLVYVFHLVRDVLADDGTLWLNIGDSYCTRPNGSIGTTGLQGGLSPHVAVRTAHARRSGRMHDGYKHKDLMGIPWMLAFALRADGWYLRQDIIWAKPNPMPESVTDRCTKSHEYVFLLSKGPRYYFDHGAIREAAAPSSLARWSQDLEQQHGSDRVPGKANGPMKAVGGRSRRDSMKRDDSKRAQVIPGQAVGTHRADRAESNWPLDSRNKRSVWTVATAPYGGAHFATFPTALIEPCVLAGAPAGATVLDPFFGSGTTGQVAQQLGRTFIGIDINQANEPLQAERLRQPSLILEA